MKVEHEVKTQTKVKVYFNLHKKTFSVVAMEGFHKGRVICRCDDLSLQDVTFKVSEAGRQRVLREKRKNVHAFVVGTLCNSIEIQGKIFSEISYNPYFLGSFFDKMTKEVVHYMPAVRMQVQDKKGRIYAR